MPDDRLIYASVFEGLFIRSLKKQLLPGTKAKLQAAGLELDLALLPAYPTQLWTDCVRIVAADLHPTVSLDEAIRLTGEVSLEGYAQTMMGQALFGILRVIGTRRGLLRMARNMSSGSNFIQASGTQLSESDFRIEVNDCGDMPTFYVGVFRRACELTGTQVKVDIEKTEGRGVSYRVHW
jgi:uncharacterized protein (TIGR02265 family)